MIETIRAGSVVQLKSGGPAMTANWVSEHNGVVSAFCEWFVQDKAPWKKEGAVFPVTSLRLLEP
jgi:uncharacterized protein YodC (DUF2158 family)